MVADPPTRDRSPGIMHCKGWRFPYQSLNQPKRFALAGRAISFGRPISGCNPPNQTDSWIMHCKDNQLAHFWSKMGPSQPRPKTALFTSEIIVKCTRPMTAQNFGKNPKWPPAVIEFIRKKFRKQKSSDSMSYLWNFSKLLTWDKT